MNETQTGQHTPGEWRVITALGSFGPKRLIIIAKPSDESDEVVMIFDAGEADSGEAQANARLAVAARDMLAACRDAITAMGCVHGEDCGKGWADCDCWMCETTRKVDDAIAKAEGRA